MNPKNKILAVDDNDRNLRILEEILESDYNVRTCKSGEEALRILSEFQPEIVLLDVMMPGMDGYEVCRRIRKEKKHSNTKVMMVSAKAMVEERLKGYEVGADEYVTKPFNDDELLFKVRVFLQLKLVEDIDAFKTKILKLLSDQLCTPLKSLTLPAEILRTEEAIDVEKRQRYAELILRNARRLQAFIENVLTLTTMRAGKWRFQIQEVELNQLVHTCISELEEKFRKRNVSVDEHMESAVRVKGDSNQLKTVLTALLDNAVRFSPPDGSVTVSVSEEDNSAYFSVTDRGKGIPPEALPQVFEAFANLHAEDMIAIEDPDGQLTQGLSLALAHEIVEQHGGEISVRSGVGRETKFAVRLPVTLRGISKGGVGSTEKSQVLAR